MGRAAASAQVTQADNRRVREIVDSLTRCSSRDEVTPALSELRGLLGASDGAAYRLRWYAQRFDLDWFLLSKPDSQLRSACAQVIERSGDSPLAYYDPLRPEPKQRNAVLSSGQLPTQQREAPKFMEALRAAGVGDADQLRVLVCDDSALLAWVGFYRQEPFSRRERAIFAQLVPAFRTRLIFDRDLQQRELYRASFEVALEALGSPAFLLDAAGNVVHANALGQRARGILGQVQANAREQRAESCAKVFKVRVPGAPDHSLVIASKPNGPTGPRLASMAQQWRLTPKQCLVLRELLQGKTNKQIAEELRCVEGTVELHVTAIFRKCGVDSRSALLVRFWNEP